MTLKESHDAVDCHHAFLMHGASSNRSCCKVFNERDVKSCS
jgi:hypothetical protein